jgi:uncharacterized protein (TIGR00730 family)
MPDDRLVPSEVTDDIRAMIEDAGITESPDLVARILATGIGLGLDATDRLDLKISSAALTEMRAAFQLFAPYRGIPKVTIFGSARTRPDDARYSQAAEVASSLADQGWMVVTGAGPGIMQAAAEGAGAHRSIGVSIRLPFEDKPNAVMAAGTNNVAMKYFFTRKLMLVKESQGFVCVPGGFGTLDEMFELLTLQQTGKADPTPIVLLDAPGGTFWEGLRTFVDEHLVDSGVVSPDDFDRVFITDSVDAASEAITRFWRNYDSLRWVGARLVLRLRQTPTAAEVESLNERFGFFLASGRIEQRGALDVERDDGDRVDLPRLVLTPNHFKVGSLFRLIRAINELDSADPSH